MASEETETLRRRAAEAAGRRLGVAFDSQSERTKALFTSDDGVHLCAPYSKLYPRDIQRRGQSYRHKVNANQQQFLAEGGNNAHLVLLCENLPHAYLFSYTAFCRWVGAPLRKNQYIFLAQNFRGHAGWHMHFETSHTTAKCWPLEDYELPLGNGNGGPFIEPDEEDTPVLEVVKGRGPQPETRGYSGSYDPDRPAFTYLLRFANSKIWKVGWAHDVVRRCSDINTHIPDELLEEVLGKDPVWRVYTEREWSNAAQAYEIEQVILRRLRKNGFATKGERAKCSAAEIMRVWNEQVQKHLS